MIKEYQKTQAYEKVMDFLEDQLLNEMTQSDGLWTDDSLSEQDTENYRDMGREIIRQSNPEFMEKPRVIAGGHEVIPYVNIEDDLYNMYFKEGGLDNRFEPGIARILMDLEFDRSMRYCKEYMTLKKILEIIVGIDSEEEKYDDDLNGLSYDELYSKYKTSLAMQQMRIDRRINSRQYEKNRAWIIVHVESFIQASAFLKYTDPDSPWCVCNQERKFDAFLGENKENQLYFVLHRDFRDIQKPEDDSERVWCDDVDYSMLDMDDPEYRFPAYDLYGFSMMIVHVDENGRLLQCVSRYNHSLGEFARDFLDEEELSLILGVNFYDVFI